MKIWKATLALYQNLDNENLEVKFKFEKQEEDFIRIEGGWKEDNLYSLLSDTPVVPKIEENYGSYRVVQGFTRELSLKEQRNVEKTMREKLIQHLNFKKQNIVTRIDNQIKILNNELILMNCREV